MGNGIVNKLICGDNLKALDDLIKEGIKVDLIYLDPPFFSNRHYEVVWGDEAEIRSFKDRWAGGISVYIEWMRERVSKMYDLLKDTGSLYLHCDWHASHYLKTMCDELFGYRNFRNEIIWKRTNSHNDAGRFGRIHDTILFYSKTPNHKWNVISKGYSPEQLNRYKRDEYGRLYTAQDLTASRPDSDSGKFNWRGTMPSKTRGWGYTIEQLEKWYVEGLILTKKDGTPRMDGLKRYLDEMPGKPLQSIWDDIPRIPNTSKERLGFPTQKPEALLERIIKASSNERDLVLDPFCGCGTAMAVSQRLGRKWIGIDISPTAITLITKRLEKIGGIKSKDFEVVGMPTTLSELKALEPFEFQNWVINEMKAKQSKKLTSDFGLDGYYDKTIFTEKAGIQVKQSENIGRDVVDKFETALTRGKFKKGFIVAFGFTKGSHEEAARAKGDLDIMLIKVEDLLLGKVKI